MHNNVKKARNTNTQGLELSGVIDTFLNFYHGVHYGGHATINSHLAGSQLEFLQNTIASSILNHQ
jgi:hypothetical protein